MRTVRNDQFISWLFSCLLLLACGPVRGATLLGHDIPSYLQFSDPVYTVSADQPGVLITVIRSGDFRQPVSVQFATSDGTGHAGQDYTEVSGSLVIAAGRGLATFTVPVLNDPLNQSTATVLLSLSQASPNAIITRSKALINIVNPATLPAPPTLTVHPDGQGGIVITWPSSTPGCVLEQSALASGGSWTNVGGTVEVVDGYCRVVQPAGAGQFFYRLRLP